MVPKPLCVERRHAVEGVIARVICIAREVSMLPEQPPSGHPRAVDDLEDLGSGQDLPLSENLEEVLELIEGCFHGLVPK